MSPVNGKEIQRDAGLDAQNDHAESLGLNEELCDQFTERGKWDIFTYQIGKDAVLK